MQQTMRKLFGLFDRDGDGKFSLEECKLFLGFNFDKNPEDIPDDSIKNDEILDIGIDCEKFVRRLGNTRMSQEQQKHFQEAWDQTEKKAIAYLNKH